MQRKNLLQPRFIHAFILTTTTTTTTTTTDTSDAASLQMKLQRSELKLDAPSSRRRRTWQRPGRLGLIKATFRAVFSLARSDESNVCCSCSSRSRSSPVFCQIQCLYDHRFLRRVDSE
ncbi:uncharacterized protein V6R79_010285 [Siganus canaliculatus]